MEIKPVTSWKYGYYRVNDRLNTFKHTITCKVDYSEFESFKRNLDTQKIPYPEWDYEDSGYGHHVFSISTKNGIQKIINSGAKVENIEEFYQRVVQDPPLTR